MNHRISRLGIGVAALACTAMAPALLGPPVGATESSTVCEGRQATIVGTAGADNIVGTDGPDVIAAGAGNDVIDGRGGNDVICGESGVDFLIGGPGDDRLFGGVNGVWDDGDESWAEGDHLRPGPGYDYVDPGSYAKTDGVNDWVDYSTSEQGVEVDIRAGRSSGQGPDRLVGNWMGVYGSQYGDEIRGGPRADYLVGLGGADLIDGREGNDYLNDGRFDGRDHFVNDRLIGGAGSDWVEVSGGADVVTAGDGDDEVWAHRVRALRLTVFGGAGNDHVYADASRLPQRLYGGAGRDYLLSGAGADVISGGADDDSLYGRYGDDVLSGGAGVDSGGAGSGNDACYGTERVNSCETTGRHGATNEQRTEGVDPNGRVPERKPAAVPGVRPWG